MTTRAPTAQLLEDIDELRQKIHQTQSRGRGCIISIIGAALVASLVMRVAPREPGAMIGGGVAALLILATIYMISRQGVKRKVEILSQELAARERLLAHYQHTAASSGPQPSSEPVTISEIGAPQCPACHQRLMPDDIVQGACPRCKTAFTTTCHQCGTPITPDTLFCPSCHATLQSEHRH